ncbi:hypothetical protein VN97_g7085, partial [Penicillium thymicola]
NLLDFAFAGNFAFAGAHQPTTGTVVGRLARLLAQMLIE